MLWNIRMCLLPEVSNMDNTVEDKMLGANGFWLIKHSIWEQFSWFLVCIYSFYTQKWGTKNLSKIGHSCQVPKMA